MGMGIGSLATWLAVALEFLAAGAIVIWPDQRWIDCVGDHADRPSDSQRCRLALSIG